MSYYQGYGYAPYYYPSVGAWPWGYVGQAPPSVQPPPFVQAPPMDESLEERGAFLARARWDSLRRAYQELLNLLVAKRVITRDEMLTLLKLPTY